MTSDPTRTGAEDPTDGLAAFIAAGTEGVPDQDPSLRDLFATMCDPDTVARQERLAEISPRNLKLIENIATVFITGATVLGLYAMGAELWSFAGFLLLMNLNHEP